MKRFSWQISKYVLQAVLPYFAFTWLLLSVILFVHKDILKKKVKKAVIMPHTIPCSTSVLVFIGARQGHRGPRYNLKKN